MYFIFLSFYKNKRNITNKKKEFAIVYQDNNDCRLLFE